MLNLTKILLAWGFLIKPDVVLHENAIDIYNDTRNETRHQLVITSNFRDTVKNREVGGLPNSKHLCGKAVDYRRYDLNQKVIEDILRLRHKYDIVIEEDHIHIEKREDC